MYLTITIDDEANALYLKFKEGEIQTTEEYPVDEVFIDLDASRQVLGIEILAPESINVPIVLKEISVKYNLPDFSRFLVEPLVKTVARE